MKNFLIWFAALIVGAIMVIGGFWTISYTAPIIHSAGKEAYSYSTWQILGAEFLEMAAAFILFGGLCVLFCACCVASEWWRNMRRHAG